MLLKSSKCLTQASFETQKTAFVLQCLKRSYLTSQRSNFCLKNLNASISDGDSIGKSLFSASKSCLPEATRDLRDFFHSRFIGSLAFFKFIQWWPRLSDLLLSLLCCCRKDFVWLSRSIAKSCQIPDKVVIAIS